ncbi:MAG: aldo/keto reductase [Alphaproteobacteria bacterium]|nr:aldo/keto reductase [Alphaproteobacteria bacterium]
MRKQQLSANGPIVSALGLGCMGMSEFYGPIDEMEAVKTLERAVELGVTHFDTADIYGFGHNEELLGKTLKSHRNQLFIATKFGVIRDKNDPLARGVNGHADYVKQSCEGSLKRLGIDTIDLYYVHRIDPLVPIENTMEALAELVQQGKIRYIGLSEASPEVIRRAHAVHPLTAIQTEYSLWSRSPEKEVIPLCQSLGIGFVAYSPIGRGFLSGKIKTTNVLDQTDARRYFPRMQDENFAHNLKIVDLIENFAKTKNCTPTQLCLAWVLAQGDYITAIPGTRHRSYLEENCNAFSINLTPDDISRLSETFPFGYAKGDRYPPGFMVSYGLKE